MLQEVGKGGTYVLLGGNPYVGVELVTADIRTRKEQGLRRGAEFTPRTEALRMDRCPFRQRSQWIQGLQWVSVSRCEQEFDLVNKVEKYWFCDNLGVKN